MFAIAAFTLAIGGIRSLLLQAFIKLMSSCIFVYLLIKIKNTKYYNTEVMHNIEIPHKNKSLSLFPQDIERLGWCPAGSVLPHGEKVPP